MQRAAPLLILATLLVPLASALTIPQPRWQVGDEWTYEIELVEDGTVIQRGERHVVVTQRGTFAGRDALWFTSYQNMTGDPSSSFADIRDATTGALLGTESGGQTLTAVAPCDETQYPLEYPKSWTVSCDLGFGPSETTYTVAGEERLTIPAGTYDTLSVDAIGHDAVRLWFTQAACGKVAEFSQTNDLATYVNLTRVKCTASSPTPTVCCAVTTTSATTPTPARATPTVIVEHNTTDPDGGLPSEAGANDNASRGNAKGRTDTPGLGIPALFAALVATAAMLSRRKPS